MNVGIVDASSVFYPAWHAGADKAIGFAFDVTLQRVRRFAAQGFDRVVVACDCGPCFRHELSPSYKAHRLEKDEAMLEQLRRVQEACDRDGCHVLACPGFEADDIIASVCAWFVGIGARVEILSGDKDLLPLLGPTVAYRSVRTDRLITADDVTAKFGVQSHQMRDLLALAGDTADGIPGVRNIGIKRAAELLSAHGSIEGIQDALDAKDENDEPVLKPGIHAALTESFRSGTLMLCRSLVTLRADVPIDTDALMKKKDPQPQRPDFGADLPEDEVETKEQAQGDSVVQVQETVKPAAEERPEEATERIIAQIDWSRGLEPRGLRDATWVAKQLHESRLLAGPPARDGELDGKSGYGSPEQILAVILAGRELGLGAMTSLRGINIIRGKVSMSAILMVGLCVARAAEYFELIESTPERATYETKRRGRGRVLTMTYTLDQAKSYGLYPGKRDRFGNPSQWEKDPANMLVQRCGARAARAFYPDIVAGVYTPDELEE